MNSCTPTPITKMGSDLYAKLEWHHPTGSAKYRPARAMLEGALGRRELRRGKTVIESSSGNMGLALAHCCRELDFDFVCVVDPNTPEATRQQLRSQGVQLVCAGNPDPRTGSYLESRRRTVASICRKRPDKYFWPDQYRNPDNPKAHMQTLLEAVEQLGFWPRQVLCAAGSWGTALGVTRAVLEARANCRVVAVDATGQSHGLWLPGLGYGRRPEFPGWSRFMPDQIQQVSVEEGRQGCLNLAALDTPAGASSGAVWAAYQRLSTRLPGPTLMLFADHAWKYRALWTTAPVSEAA